MYYIVGGKGLILNTDGAKPIYVQISDWLETEIMSGQYQADQKIYSQYQLADMFNINPATAAKGLNLLVEQDILYKKRGLGMFVFNDAREKIIRKRKNQTLKKLLREVVLEARRLGIEEKQLIEMVKDVNLEGED